MAVDVKAYMQHLETYRGKLASWEKDIFTLYHAHMSYEDIAKFLVLNNVAVNRMEVYRFIHRKKRAHLHQQPPADTAPPGEIPSRSMAHPEPVSSTSEPQQPGTSLPKFKWRQGRNKDDPKW